MEAFMRLVHFSIKQHKKKFFLNATKTDKDLSIQKHVIKIKMVLKAERWCQR